MKTQLKKLGMGLVLAALPLMASTTSAQWTPQDQASPNQNTQLQLDAQLSNTVALNQDGTLVGQIANAQGDLTVFFVREGQVIRQTQISDDGSFSIQGLDEGPYSFFAAGQSGFAAYGVYVSGPNDRNGQNLLQAATASPSYAAIQQFVNSNVPAAIRNAIADAPQNGTQDANNHGLNKVRLINSELSGQINSLYGQGQLASGVQVQLIQNDRPIAQVQTDAFGQFRIPDVQPGVYDFVAASQNGFTAGRFEAAASQGPMTKASFRRTSPQLVASLTTPSPLTSQAIDYDVEPSFEEPIEYAGESAFYGGASGGSGGGAGNFSNFSGNGVVRGRFGGSAPRTGRFRGNGLGRLLTLAGLGLGITALADEDAPPASPILP